MRFPISWINEFVDLPDRINEIKDLYTSIGIEVESVIDENGETIFDFNITPNRPDCMNVYGLAREASAALCLSLKPFDININEDGEDITKLVSVRVLDGNLCPRYVACLVKGIRADASPDWMQKRLLACGLRPINNIVDITNYVLLELGHPLHAFDFDSINNHMIIVRRAENGEIIKTLDGTSRSLCNEDIVIADEKSPIALAGIMGGDGSGVTKKTKDVLLEGAVFNPVSIRRSSRRYKILSDASYRFERGVDAYGPIYTLSRTVKLISSIAGGTICRGLIDVYPEKRQPTSINLRTSRVNMMLGIEVPEDFISSILRSLDFKISKKRDTYSVEVPTYRVDIKEEIDLIEEIARHFGLDRLLPTLPSFTDQNHIPSIRNKRLEIIRDTVSSYGFSEAVHFDFTSKKLYSDKTDLIAITNPLSEQTSHLRRDLLPQMIETMSRNRARGVLQQALFEIGRIYLQTNNKLPDEHEQLIVVFTKEGKPGQWEWGIPANIPMMKAIVLQIFRKIGLSRADFRESPEGLVDVLYGKSLIGEIRKISPPSHLELRDQILYFKIDLEDILMLPWKEPAFKPLPKFPVVERDITMLFPENKPYRALEGAILSGNNPILDHVEFLGEYKSKDFSQGMWSMTVRLFLKSEKATLKDDEIENTVLGIIRKCEDAGAHQRVLTQSKEN